MCLLKVCRPVVVSCCVRPSERALSSSILAAGAVVVLFPAMAAADILQQYTFGTTPPSSLGPTTLAGGILGSAITADAGNTLDLLSNQTPAPASSPWLRVVPTGAWTTPELAVANNADFKFTIAVDPHFTVTLSSLTFGVMRGGGSTPRGYDVRSSLDNYAVTLGQAAAPTQRPTFTPVSIDLSAAAFQNALLVPAGLTFKIYSYSPATGASVEYDDITLNGTTTFNGYTWKATTDSNWNVTAANWAGTGTVYADATPTSDVYFDDSASSTTVNVLAAGLSPNLLYFGNSSKAYTFSGGALNVASGIVKSGSNAVTFNNAVSSSSVQVNSGSIIVEAGGILTSPSLTVANGATLAVVSGSLLGSSTGLIANGAVNLSNANQTVATLSNTIGVTTGVVALNSTVLEVAGASTYDGKIIGTGSITKSGNGTLILTNAASTFNGGIVVNGGAVQISGAAAAGFGAITVNPNGILNLGAAVTNAINLAGGTLGVSAAVTTGATVTVTANSTVKTFNAATGGTSNDLVLSGFLEGSGNLELVTLNGNAPDSQAFRLRGGSSTYSGTITVNASAKFELQTAATLGSPMGTGTLAVVGGGTTNNANGTYSLINIRNNSAAAGVVSDATFGNNVHVLGSGASYFNLLGQVAAGSTVNFGDLLIGDSQAIGAVATTSQAYTLAFATVHLNGGNSTFIPRPVGNSGFVAAENIRLGPISQNVADSGITMNGSATLELTGVNTYTGPTALLSGTTVLAAGASIATSSSVSVAQGATLDTTALGAFIVPSAQTLSVLGTETGNLSVAGILSGNGIINGSVTAVTGSKIGPSGGVGIGLLTVGNLSLPAGSVFEAELAKFFPGNFPSAGFDNDVLAVNDNTFGVTPTVQLGGVLSVINYGVIEEGDTYTIILNNGFDDVQGTFAGLPNGALFSVDTQLFQISYADDGGTFEFEFAGGNDVSIRAVPEPGSVGLLLGGLAAVAGLRRRRAPHR